jgi:lactate permease
MDRIAVLSKTLAAHDRPTQILLFNCAFAFILMALGAVPMTVLPAILLPLGYSVVHSIALPIMGYSGGCAFALLGIPGLILATFCGISMLEAWHVLARYMPLTNFAVAAACLWFAGGLPMLKRGFIPAVIVGFGAWAGVKASVVLHIMPVAGILAGAIMTVLLFGFLLLRGSPVMDRSLLTEQDLAQERHLSLTAALAPWIMLTLIAVMINTPLLPLHRIFFVDNPMPVRIIPDHPEHLRILSQPYLWLFVASLAAAPFLKPKPGLLGSCLRKWLRRSARPALAAGVYFAIAYVFNHSGKNAAWELTSASNNMVSILATSAAQAFGVLYGSAAPFIGVATGLVSGSQAASTAMLTVLHLRTSALLGLDGVMVATGAAIGSGVSGILSPAKLMSCASSIDKPGEENSIFRALMGLCVVITCSIAVVSLAYMFL